jgi:alpha-glucosidase
MKKMLLFNFWQFSKIITIFSCIGFCSLTANAFAEKNVNAKTAEYTVTSPNNKIKLTFSLVGRIPFYKVTYDDKSVINPSSMGFELNNSLSMTKDFSVTKTIKTSVNKSWKPIWGITDSIKNNYNELTVKLKQDKIPNLKLNIIFRAYDDGIAFRYIFPEQPNLNKFKINSENTEFSLIGNNTVWWTPGDYDSYEHLYKKGLLNELKDANTPVTMKTVNGLYISIHEANLTNYSGMTLKALKNKPYTLKSELVPWPDGVTKVIASTPMNTPWRTIQIADEPGGLIVSHLIQNLNDPCIIKNISWIKPMKYMGIWWGMHIGKYTFRQGPNHGATTENAKYYIDFASKYNIPALLIEGWNEGWETWGKQDTSYNYNFTKAYSDYDLEKIVEYGHKKGVSIIAHNETGGGVTNYEKQIDDAFKFYNKLGIHAIKTGYVGKITPKGQHHHGQWMVNHYRKVLETAEKYQIMVDSHEPIKPTGISRTYPNMMTREGVRGSEYNAWSDGNPPEHTCLLPFTRGLAGPIDYTPGVFDITFKKYQKTDPNITATEKTYRVHTTIAKQLALYVVIFSPMQMVADLPENYNEQPGFKFIQNVPTTWNETKVLNAEIGSYITIARRNENKWYIGSITNKKSRDFKIPLNFLKPGQKYKAEIYADGKNADWKNNPTSIKITKKIVNSNSILNIKLAKGGGQAVIIKPLKIKTSRIHE